jgi:beta-glucosidase
LAWEKIIIMTDVARWVLQGSIGVIAALSTSASWASPPPDDPDARAAATEAAMTAAEKTVLTHGVMALPIGPPIPPLPTDAIISGGYVPGIPRLNIPSLRETDAGLGMAYALGLRKDGATALPSGMAMGATWNPALIRTGGVMIGSEARAKGFNVMLAGGINLVRDPRGGRTFEYLSEDPLLSGILGGAQVAGIQSNHIISTVKHFAFNNQETGRQFIDVKISDAAARESDLLAFEIAIERGQPGSVMCSYNKINGAYGCENDYLLNTVLKRDWGYKGFVMSDWGAVHSIDAALKGLDQQSGSQLDAEVYLGKPLANAATGAAADPKYAVRLSDMNRRILRSIYATGADVPAPRSDIDFAANAVVAENVAKEGIVLLRNRGNALPLAASAKRIAIIGGYADFGVLSGTGSSQVQGQGGPAIVIPFINGPFAPIVNQAYHPSSPLKALIARAPQTEFSFDDGRYVTSAVAAAKKADITIIFAAQWMTEGYDVADLSLPNGQDGMIAAVTAANPNTIVVLETGGPVAMPWLEQTAAVIEAWYPGARGGEAIASVLYGDISPSGRLPVTFPASVAQLPHPVLPGSDSVEPSFVGKGKPGETLSVDYDIEGADVGYRWFARKQIKPLFAFGYGLSYTHFAYSNLKVRAGRTVKAQFTVTNTGNRDGMDVPQLYLIDGPSGATQRLVAFEKVTLKPKQSRIVTITVDPRLIGYWGGEKWVVKDGAYKFALGASADDLKAFSSVELTN